MAPAYGRSQAKTADGDRVYAYYLGDYWILAGRPADSRMSSWSEWALAVYDGGTRIARESGLQEVLHPDDIESGAAISARLFGPDGEVVELDITDALVQSYQEVEGFDAHPFLPPFYKMNDGELVAWARGDDDVVDFDDLKRVKPLYQDGLIDDDQLDVIIEAFMDYLREKHDR